MREYIQTRGLRFSRPQLHLLVPAFDAAWEVISQRGTLLLKNGEQRAMKDRLAKVVVDLVIDSNENDPHVIAERAVRLILTP